MSEETRTCRVCEATKSLTEFITPANSSHHVCKRCRADKERVRRANPGFVSPKVSPERMAWKNIKTRCNNPKHNEYHRYGGRGITMCDRWKESFSAFAEDMGPRPSSKHSIDRRDNDGNYEPGNCRWATKREQSLNTSKNHRIEHDGKLITVQELSEIAGVGFGAMAERIDRGLRGDRLVAPKKEVTRHEAFGASRTLSEWAILYGTSYLKLHYLLRKGKSLEEALTLRGAFTHNM